MANEAQIPQAPRALTKPRWGALAGIGAALLVLALILFAFDPGRHGFYPRCTLHATTGLNCPGCGALRAVHQLLHGNLAQAFALNPLLVLLLPLFAWVGIAHLITLLSGRKAWHPFARARFAWALLGVVIGFGILRNVPLVFGNWLVW